MTPKSICFCGDASAFSRSLAGGIADAGFAVERFERADDLERVLDESCAAVVIVNPHLHQAKAVRAAMRTAGGWASRVPFIIERVAEIETLKHFDDFLAQGAGAPELLARVRLLVARRGKGANSITHGDLAINIDAHQVTVGGRPVDLTYKEYELLKTIAATPGRAYSREELLKNIWGYDYFGGTRTVDVHIRRLRSKIETTEAYIETVHGVGYRFTSGR
jgi:DNA-binding response OmpR family regulator